MEDRLKGIDALSNVPFVEIALPQKEAIDALKNSAIQSRDSNIDHILVLNPQLPADAKNELESIKTREVGEQGLVINQRVLELIYSDLKGKTFSNLLDIIPIGLTNDANEKELGRNLGCFALGAFIDLSNMVPESVASFKEKSQMFFERCRAANISPLMLGAMCDDAAHLRSASPDGVELFIDREKVIEFASVALENLDQDGKRLFMLWVTVDRNELYIALHGISLN